MKKVTSYFRFVLPVLLIASFLFTSVPETSEAATLLSDGFGVGASANDIPSWDEEGTDTDATTLAKAFDVSGEDVVSPNGDRFAKIGEDEWICRQINATGFSNLVLKYYWRGDDDGENNDDLGIVEHRPASSCTAASGWINDATHELDDASDGGAAWSSLQTINLPSNLDGTTFSIRFRNVASSSDEYFRVDGIVVEEETPTGSISGQKFIDTDGDGVKDEGETTGQSEITITLNPGSVTTTTDGDGNYTFSNLAPDTYTITETVPGGYVQTTANPAAIVLSAGQNVTGINFGNFELTTVSGIKFDDENGDGQKQEEEEVIPSWPIALAKVLPRPQPANPPGPGNEIPIEIVQLQLTGGGGQYTFNDVGSGEFLVIEGKDPAWNPTFPTLDSFFDVYYEITNPAFPGAGAILPPATESFFDIFIQISGAPVTQGFPSVGALNTVGVPRVGSTPTPLSFGNLQVAVPPPAFVTVTIVKYIQEEGYVPATAENTDSTSFGMTATWNATNIGSGSGDFALDADGFNGDPTPYQAITSEMTSGADYSVVENLGTVCTEENEGEYILKGYKIGNTIEDALESETVQIASLTNITTDKVIIVINKKCNEYVPPAPTCDADAEVILNGNFEEGIDAGVFVTLNSGDEESITNWTVGGEGVDYIGSYWQDSDGSGESIDLNALAAGSISQTIETEVGKTYVVTFDLSGNPENQDSDLASPTLKEVEVSATGDDSETFSFDTSVEGNSLSDMKWQKKTYTFTATSESTTITFESQIAGAFGPALDNVGVKELCPEEGTITIIKNTVGGNGIFTFTLTDHESITIDTSESSTSGPITIDADTEYTVDEPNVPEGWDFTSLTCEYEGESAGIVGPNPTSYIVSVGVGENVTCTYTNTKDVVDVEPTTGTLIVKKIVINDNGGTQTADDFSFTVTAGDSINPPVTFIQNEENPLLGQNNLTDKSPDTYTITETTVSGYTTTYDGCSGVVLGAGETKTCTITNNDNPVTESDVCPNIEGMQNEIPNNMHLSDGGDCVPNRQNSSGSVGNGGGSVLGASTGGEVLGAETSCGLTMTPSKFMKKGYKGNDIAQVKILQQFLNDNMKAGLTVDGIFGNATEVAVKAFQLAHKDKILKPWGLTAPTGVVYITTIIEINNIMCPELKIQIPTNLVPYN